MKKLPKVILICVIIVFSMTMVSIGCKTDAVEETIEEAVEEVAEAVEEAIEEVEETVEESTEEAMEYPEIDFNPTEIYGLGPNGETAVNTRELTLTDEEKAELKDLGGTVVINFHGMGNFPNQMRFEGAEATLIELGVEILASTDGQFDVNTLISNIESTLALGADVMLSMPMDPDATASTYRTVLDTGTKLVFLEQAPTGFVGGVDYESVVSSDNYGIGIGSAHVTAKLIGYKGKVGMIVFDANFFVTNQRDDGFKDTIAEFYPDIEIVAIDGFADASDMSLITVVADGMLANNPDIDCIYAGWDDPAAAVVTAVKSAGADCIVTTTDITGPSAIAIASNDILMGSDTSLPWDMGVGYAMAAAYTLLGKEVPVYAVPPHLPVLRENVIEAYKTAYNTDAPQEVIDAFNAAE